MPVSNLKVETGNSAECKNKSQYEKMESEGERERGRERAREREREVYHISQNANKPDNGV